MERERERKVSEGLWLYFSCRCEGLMIVPYSGWGGVVAGDKEIWRETEEVRQTPHLMERERKHVIFQSQSSIENGTMAPLSYT